MKLVYNDLPRPLRERLVAATRPGDPAVLAATPDSDDAPTYAVVAAVAFLASMVVAGVALKGVPAFALGLVPTGTVLFTVAAVFASRKRWPLPPYRTGQFAIGPWIVTARWGEIELASLGDVVDAKTTHFFKNHNYTGSHVSLRDARGNALGWFGFREKEAAAAAVAALEDMRRRYGAAVAARDLAAMRALDPFHDVVAAGPQPPPAGPVDGPLVALRPPWLSGAVWGVGFAASVVVTLPVWGVGSWVAGRAYPGAGSSGSATSKAATADRYAKAIAIYEARAATDASKRFMRAAFDKMAATGNPSMPVRFRMPSASALAKVDAELPKQAIPVGPTYAQAMERKRPDVVRSLSVALDKALPYRGYTEPAILSLSEAASDDVLGDQPRVEITLEVRAARDAYKSAGHPRAYGGVSTRFHVVASVPGSSEKLTADLDVPSPPADLVAKHYESSADLYVQGSLHGWAWEQLTPKLVALFVK